MILKSWSIKIWKNGKCLDLWSINHVLAGCLLSALSFFFEINFLIGLAFSVLLMIGWELYEIANNVEETWCNRTMDIVVGVTGFVLIFLTFQRIENVFAIVIFWIILGLWLFLEWKGFIAYKTIQKSKSKF